MQECDFYCEADISYETLSNEALVDIMDEAALIENYELAHKIKCEIDNRDI